MSRDEKLSKARRRLQAVAFLKNISLDGSYKDTSWHVDFQKLNRQFQSKSSRSGASGSGKHRDESVFPPTEDDLDEIDYFDKSTASGSRKRSSTFEGGYISNRRRSKRGSLERESGGKHAHFSSNESLDHGLRCMSNSDSDESSIGERGEVKFVNMREIPAPEISDQRLVILVSKRTPVLVFSTIPYRKANQRVPIRFSKRRKSSRRSLPLASLEELPSEVIPLRRTRNISGSRPLSLDPDPLEQLIIPNEEVSYAYLLDSSTSYSTHEKSTDPLLIALGETPPPPPTMDYLKHHTRCHSYEKTPSHPTVNFPVPPPSSEGDASNSDSHSHSHNTLSYSPHLLDDPEFRGGRHRTVLTFSGYITSIIDYCKASDMKKELNDKFKERFPHINLTLSKLRSLKRDMRKVKVECSIDWLTIANAYVYFEKLILASYVNKYNRKLASGACLLLSAKMNDIKGDVLHLLIEKIETIFRVSKKELITFEFAVLVALGFNLHSPSSEIYPHYQRLLYES